MIGSFLTRGLALILGYAYPAYECFKTVELNKPEIEQLVFWCQYWILVASLTVLERVGDNFVSWIPMYGEAKLAFFVYLWYPKTKGTTYVYETFFRPYVAKHESDIDRNLLELRTRAGDFVVVYLQKAASFGQTRFFEILQYIASQSPSQASRSRPVPAQRPQAPHIRRPTVATSAGQQKAPSQPLQRNIPSSSLKNQLQEVTKAGVPQPGPVAGQKPTSSTSQHNSEGSTIPKPATEGEIKVQDTVANGVDKDHQNSPVETPSIQETAMEEAIRLTRGRMRKRTATGSVPAL